MFRMSTEPFTDFGSDPLCSFLMSDKYELHLVVVELSYLKPRHLTESRSLTCFFSLKRTP